MHAVYKRKGNFIWHLKILLCFAHPDQEGSIAFDQTAKFHIDLSALDFIHYR